MQRPSGLLLGLTSPRPGRLVGLGCMIHLGCMIYFGHSSLQGYVGACVSGVWVPALGKLRVAADYLKAEL